MRDEDTMPWVKAMQAVALARAKHRGETRGGAPQLRAADVRCTWSQLRGSQSLGCSQEGFTQKHGHSKALESWFGCRQQRQGREEAAPGDGGTVMLGKSLVQGPARSAPEPGPCVCKMF